MKITEGGKLDRPNVCFLCETTPPHGMKVVDTERYFDGHPYNLQGRRYVCEKCINSMLVFFDFVDLNRLEQAELEAKNAQNILRGLKLRLDTLFNDLRQIAESPNLLLDGLSGSVREQSQSIVVGNGEGTEVDSGSSVPSPEGVEPQGLPDNGSEGGHTAPFEPQLAVSGEADPSEKRNPSLYERVRGGY